MKALRSLIVSFLLLFPVSAYADTVSGMVVDIIGQRVTILTDSGEEVTLTVEESESLQVGDEVQIEFSPVGDALLATDVQHLQ